MGFHGAHVLSFESRRAVEIAELIRISGGDPIIAPALIEVPLEENKAALEFADGLEAGSFDAVVFLTGVGARFLGRVLESRPQWLEALRKVAVVARGPKPATVLREWQVPIAAIVPEPNTWREVLATMQSIAGRRVAIQEYGRANHSLVTGLKEQGREVSTVQVYQWKLPEDTGPLQNAIQHLLAGQIDVTLFTTGVQMDHLMQFAEDQREKVLDALRKTFVASIGPDTSEALRSYGLEPSFAPSHPKMGILVREAAAKFSP